MSPSPAQQSNPMKTETPTFTGKLTPDWMTERDALQARVTALEAALEELLRTNDPCDHCGNAFQKQGELARKTAHELISPAQPEGEVRK